jgi:hypothetical protein
LSTEVAAAQDFGEATHACRAIPVIRGRQCFAGKLGIRFGFVPADAADGIVRLSLGIRPQLPRCKKGG